MENQMKMSVRGSLHSSIVEGSKPDWWGHQVHRDQHLPVLFEGLLEPLHQADGLVLQRVHLSSLGLGLLPPALLRGRCGTGLRLLLRWLVFGLMRRLASGRQGQPAWAGGRRQRRAESTAAKQRRWLWNGRQHWAHRCHPPQRPANQDALHYHPLPCSRCDLKPQARVRQDEETNIYQWLYTHLCVTALVYYPKIKCIYLIFPSK